MGAWAAVNTGYRPEGSPTGWGFTAAYPNDLVDCSAGINRFGLGLEPALGFLPRPGITRYSAGCDVRPRPSKNGRLKLLRQVSFQNRFSYVKNHLGETESWQFFWAPIDLTSESGERLEFNYVPTFEYLPEPFEVATGVFLPVGKYRFDRFRAEVSTSGHRLWQFNSATWFGTFYSGRLIQQENNLNFTDRKGRWQVGLSSNQNFGRLPQGNFVQRLFQTNFAYALSPRLVWTSFMQYDTVSQSVGNNMRVRWTPKPGTDLFVVWNRGWTRPILSRDELSLLPERDLLVVKLRWTFRI